MVNEFFFKNIPTNHKLKILISCDPRFTWCVSAGLILIRYAEHFHCRYDIGMSIFYSGQLNPS